jgi:PKD domain
MKKIKSHFSNIFILIIYLIVIINFKSWSQLKGKQNLLNHKVDSALINKNFQMLNQLSHAIHVFVPGDTPQVNPSVHLTKDKDLISPGESVIFTAELSKPDKEALYIYTINNKESFATGRNLLTALYTFPESGTFIVSVIVRTRNQLLRDTLIVNVNNLVGDIIPAVPKDSITLEVENPQSNVGDTVFFKALSNNNSEGVVYRFNFGDKSTVQSLLPNVEHVYKKPDYYTASVQIIINNQLLPIFSTAVVIVEQPIQPNVTLTILNPTAYTNDTITLIASTNLSGGLEYEFNLGIKSKFGRTDKDTIKFVYSNSGQYSIFVTLFQNGKEAALSEKHIIVIKSPPVPDWLKFVVIGFLIFAASYTIRKFLIKPAITIHPFPDKGLAKIKEPKNFNINYEVHFNPNLANANYLLNSNEENLIKSKTVK